VSRSPFVVEADVSVDDGTDPGALGAAVTTSLCGHWDHDGPCRWPHNNAVEGTTFRTIVVAPTDEEDEVRSRIEQALRSAQGWDVHAIRARALLAAEQALAERLAATPAPD
jgi:hypothetical protein